MFFTSFPLNIYTLIDLEMTSKLSKVKWKHKPLFAGECRFHCKVLNIFTSFLWLKRMQTAGNCFRLFFSVFDMAMSILSWKIVFEGQTSTTVAPSCNIRIALLLWKKTFPHMLTNLKLSGEYYLFLPIVLFLCCFPSFQ